MRSRPLCSGLLFAFLLTAAGAAAERTEAVESARNADLFEPRTGLAPGSAPAAVTFSLPGADSVLRGGDTVEVRWSGVPASAEEVELLLSIDGGRTASLRLTEELDAGTSSFLWRVPNLATSSATLLLRMGLDGNEILSAAGPAFRISSDPSLSGLPLRWQSGEIWVDSPEAMHDARGQSLPESGLAAAPDRMRRIFPDGPAALSPTRAAAGSLTLRVRRAGESVPRASAAMASAAERSRAPSVIPQRI